MKILCAIWLLLLTSVAFAGEWVTLKPSDLLQYEVSKQGGAGSFDEGLYIKNRSFFITSLSSTNKSFVLIKAPKLADRALSSLLYASATGKSMQFYVDGCNQGNLLASIFMVII